MLPESDCRSGGAKPGDGGLDLGLEFAQLGDADLVRSAKRCGQLVAQRGVTKLVVDRVEQVGNSLEGVNNAVRGRGRVGVGRVDPCDGRTEAEPGRSFWLLVVASYTDG